MENIKRYKKAPAVQEKEAFTDYLVSGTQTEILHVKSEPQIDTDKTFGYHHLIRQIYCLNLNRMSDSTDTDSDDDYTKIIFDDLCVATPLLNRLELF